MSFSNHTSSVASFGTRELRIINEKDWGKYRNLESSGEMLKQKTESLYYRELCKELLSDYILKVVFHDKNECAI